jgi:EAL domain-containing protein (putative c-di-GMP-specific phosphodiesterase class I)
MRTSDGELVAAGQFVPAAEQFNMVKELDAWVIPEAMRIAAATGRPVQFNLSAASLQDPATPGLIEEALVATGADPSAVVIEVTESGLIDEHAVAERFAHRVVGLGCRLALDDFGTGYGGFTYLTRLPIDILKIDRSFVRDLPANDAGRKVVSAVVGLGREFGQTVIAEGVEDEASLNLLRELGVDQAQGYFIGRPGPLAG